MQRTFAQELAEGKISMMNLKLSAYVLAGHVDEHEVITGLLFAAYLTDQSDYWRRGISTGCRTETSEVHEQGIAIEKSRIYPEGVEALPSKH